MDSKEFGLVSAQQLFQIEDLHYGFWDKNEEAKLSNWKDAQLKHTQFLFSYIEKFISDRTNPKILDIGCGTGSTTKKLLDKGHIVDGLVPYPWMAKHASDLIANYINKNKANIFECRFEDFPTNNKLHKYDLVFFSESFQYVNMEKAFDKLERILTKNGIILIFDFFKKDNTIGVSPLGGGHSIGSFFELIKKYNYNTEHDIDVTKNLSPNLKLVNEILNDRLIPFSRTLNKFLLGRHKTVYKIIKFLLKSRINKMKFKYSSERNEANFIQYKTYRMIVLSRVS